MRTTRILAPPLLTGLGWLGLLAASAAGQSSSLLGNPDQRQMLNVANLSWTYQPPDEKRELKINDLVTVLVDEKASVTSDAQIDQKKQANGKLTLSDWIVFGTHFGVKPDPQTAGSPTVGGKIDNKYQANADLETKEAVTLRLTCHVVDIRPNGTLVLEGRRSITVNDETWEVSLCGSVRPEDVLPNNSVLSGNVADMRLMKRETGQVRDGYQRWWMLRWIDNFNPF